MAKEQPIKKGSSIKKCDIICAKLQEFSIDIVLCKIHIPGSFEQETEYLEDEIAIVTKV